MFSRRGRSLPYLIILLGSAVLSFGLYNIHSQVNITEGGVLGAILLLQHWFGIPPGLTSLVLDLSCYLLAFRFLGRAFAKYAVVASVAFSLSYSLWEQFPPVLPDLSARPVLAALLGGLFVGLGVGLVVRIGGACGGDDALALTISHLTHCPISRAYLATDLTVLLLSLSYIPFRQIVYSLITVTVSSVLIGRVQKLGLPKQTPEATSI